MNDWTNLIENLHPSILRLIWILILAFPLYRIATFILRVLPGRKPKPGWVQLPTPKRYCVYHKPDDFSANGRVAKLFQHAIVVDEKRISKRIISRVLVKGLKGDKERIESLRTERSLKWGRLVAESETSCFVVYPCKPFVVIGWAQSKNAHTSDCILGLEGFILQCAEIILLRHLTLSTMGHELVHVAQEARGGIPTRTEMPLRDEWLEKGGFWKWLRIESEAWSMFPLSCLTFAIPAALITIWFFSFPLW